ncbi:MAG: hypothetical protein H8E27_01700 [Verrucomicrobia subdivision 3 bacterium]|nr:hypothetical protein [Limisphaerales bacterium]
MMDKKTANQFAKTLAGTLVTNGAPESVPSGWYTVAEIAGQLGKSYSHTGRMLCASVRAGIIERRQFRIQTPRGLYPTNHFKFK